MASPLQGGHWEATLFSPCYNWDWIKSCSIFSQSWQLSFFKNDTQYPRAPQRAPLPPFSWRHTWRRACVGGGWEMDEWCCGGVCEGSDARVAHLCPATTHDCLHLFVAVCVSRSTWLVTVGQKVSHIFLNTLCYRRSHMEPSVCGLSVGDRFPTFLFHRLWRIFLFYEKLSSLTKQKQE